MVQAKTYKAFLKDELADTAKFTIFAYSVFILSFIGYLFNDFFLNIATITFIGAVIMPPAWLLLDLVVAYIKYRRSMRNE